MPGPGVDCLVTVSGQPQAAPQQPDPKFPHTSATKQTVTGKPQVTVFAPGAG